MDLTTWIMNKMNLDRVNKLTNDVQTAVNTATNLNSTVDAKVSGKIDLLTKRKNDILRSYNRAIKKWDYPAWFTWKDAPITIMSDGTNFYTPFDVATFKNTGGKNLYVDSVNGLDTNSGLTTSLQLKSVQKAYDLASDGDTIVCKPGVYKRAHVISASTLIEKNINIVSDGTGPVRWFQADYHNYTKTAGATNVYQTARNNITHVVDLQLLNINGETIALKSVASIAECDATEGSYFMDGTNTYIHMIGHVVPNDNNVVILLQTGNPALKVTNATKNISLYVEGIEFYGGTANIYVGNSATYLDPKVYMKKCKMRYSSTLNAVHILGATSYFQDCEASYSVLDGFNYHASNGRIVKSIEVNCLGRGNGDNSKSTDVNNGSTTHDGSKAIRINCVYYENMGVNCCDVTEDTMSINLGVVAFNSKAQDANIITHGNFSAQQPGTTMYLEGCVSFGSTFGIVPVTGTTMYLKNCLYDTKNGGGTLTIL